MAFAFGARRASALLRTQAPFLAAAARKATLVLGTGAIAFSIAGSPAFSASWFDLRRADEEFEADNGPSNESARARREHLAVMQRMRDTDPENAEVLWRYARAAYAVSQLKDEPPAERRRLIEDGLRAVTEAKNRERNNGAIFRLAGQLLDAASQYVSTADYIRNSYVVKSDYEEALVIDPGDSKAQHLLGAWLLRAATFNSVWRLYTRWLVAEPPSATLEEAKQALQKADKLEPNWVLNMLWLGKCELAMGSSAAAAPWLAQAAAATTYTAEDKDSADEALKLLQKVDSAKAKAVTEARLRAQAEAEERARQKAGQM